MKMIRFNKIEFANRLEDIAQRLKDTALQIREENTAALLTEQLRQKATELLSLFKASLFRQEGRRLRPEFLRTRVRKRVYENLQKDYKSEAMIELITDCLIQAAEHDPYYRKFLV